MLNPKIAIIVNKLNATSQLVLGSRYGFSLLCFFHLFLVTAYFISDSFTGSGFDDSVIYFLITGADGFDLEGYSHLLYSTVALIGLALFISFRLPARWAEWFKRNRSLVNIINSGLILMFVAQPVTASLIENFSFFLGSQKKITIDFEPAYPGEIKLQNRPDIIYLYAEGLERSFLDDELFPGLAPNLRRLESSTLHFTNIDRVYGTGWTVAGMVASQCGLPLLPVANANQPGTFMPKAYCLGDILKENGYQLSYLGGASLRFGGKGNFYQTHQFDTVLGREQWLDLLPEIPPLNDWGLYDDDLFPLVKTHIEELKLQSQPYALMLLTLDTHPPDGYPSASCKNMPYSDGSNPMLNAVHCSDLRISEFVETLQKMPGMDNTIIIVGSDHLMPNHAAYEQLEKNPTRRNLLFALGTGIEPQAVDRYASTMDITPTLLGLIGADSTALNLG
ncbi:MAG: phosphoglycerol transferase, partial [Gammaproteobacteria bacterium]